MMQRYDIDMNGDDLLIEPEPDGDWVKYAEAEAEVVALQVMCADVDRLTGENMRLKAEAEVREALLKDAYELLGKATSEPLGLVALRALVVDRAVEWRVDDQHGKRWSLQAEAALREAVDAYRAKVVEVMGADEPVARMHKFASEYE